MKKLLTFALMSMLLFGLNFSDLKAQDEENTEKESLAVFDLGQIEVVGESTQPQTTSVTVIDEVKFDEKAFENVVETLPASPGITVTTGSKNEPQFIMRGFRQERVLILYDGVPMAAPYYSDVDTSEIPLDNLSEIEVIRGNASVLYGPNAMAGVVSLVSGKPSHKPNLNIFASLDQEANVIGRISHGAFVSDNMYYQITAGLRQSDGWRMSDDFKTTYDEDGYVLEDGDIRNHSEFDQWSAGLKIGREWENGEISLLGNYIDSQKDIPATTNSNDRINYWDFPTWKKAGLILAAKTQLTEKIDLRTNLFYHQYDNVLRNYKDSEYDELRWESTYDDYSAGANIRLAFDLNDTWVFRTALNGVLDNHRSQSDTGEPWEEYEARTYSIAGETDWTIAPEFTLHAGLGFEVYDFKSVDNVPSVGNSISKRTEDVDAFTYTVLGEYRLDDAQRLTCAVSLKNRFPNMSQLFSNIEEFPPEDVTTLKTEKALQYSLGYDYQSGNALSMGANLYYYDVDNLIERPDRDSLYENINTAEFKGIEAWIHYLPSTAFFGSLTLTHQQATGDLNGESDQDLPYVPENMMQAEAGYAFSFGFRASAQWTYRDDSIQYDSYGDRVDIPSYSLWSISLQQELLDHLTLSIHALNLLDKNYYTEIGFEQPGRTLKFAVKYVL